MLRDASPLDLDGPHHLTKTLELPNRRYFGDRRRGHVSRGHVSSVHRNVNVHVHRNVNFNRHVRRAVVGGAVVGHRYHGGIHYGHVRRYWHGQWWAYGVGSCWRWTPDGYYVWVCF